MKNVSCDEAIPAREVVVPKPFVYGWYRQDTGKYIYIGATNRGLARFTSHAVISLKSMTKDDWIHFWYPKDDETVFELERRLIHFYQPMIQDKNGKRFSFHRRKRLVLKKNKTGRTALTASKYYRKRLLNHEPTI